MHLPDAPDERVILANCWFGRETAVKYGSEVVWMTYYEHYALRLEI